MVPEDQRVPPLYPQQFQSAVQGFLVYPFTQQWWHVDIPQDNGTRFYYDWARQQLKFHNRVPVALGTALVTDFVHGPGDKIHAVGYGFCICTTAGIGILRYDAFQDATYLGRERKFIEYLNVTRAADHYLKGPHHLWVDVATGLPLRAWQPSNGLQVYSDWVVGPPDAAEFATPPSCLNVQCTEAPPPPPLSTPAHALPHSMDVLRAHQRLPHPELRGPTFAAMNAALNRHLAALPGLRLRDCGDFRLEELQAVADTVRAFASASLQAVYAGRGDRRRLLALPDDARAALWAQQAAATAPALREVARDGLCHEVMMWYAHHVPQHRRPALHAAAVLPRLPTTRHWRDPGTLGGSAEADLIWAHYERQIECTACHLA
eukprot:EG_transcript_11460